MTNFQQKSDETIASWTIADLDARMTDIAKKVIEEKEHQKQGNPLLGGLTKEEILEKPYDMTAQPFWETALEISNGIADEEWATLPTDGSINVDHYLYGAPKVEE